LAQGRVRGRAVDPAPDLSDLRLALLGREPALLHQLADLATGDVPGLIEAGLHERVVDVLQDDWYACCGDRLSDLAAHRPGAHDGGFEHEHAFGLLGWLAGRAC